MKKRAVGRLAGLRNTMSKNPEITVCDGLDEEMPSPTEFVDQAAARGILSNLRGPAPVLSPLTEPFRRAEEIGSPRRADGRSSRPVGPLWFRLSGDFMPPRR